MNEIKIGDVSVLPIHDTPLILNPDFFFPGVADEMRREFADLTDERGFLQVSITTFLVRSEGKTILIDSGLGGRRRPTFPRGHLPEFMAQAGVSPADIDLVVHTHLHVDHVGWNTVENEDGAPEIFFPRAEFIAQRTEWDYWMTPEKLAEESNAHLRECVVPVEKAGRVRIVDHEEALDTNLTFIPTPGHTPGHVAIGIYSQGERGVIIGDASHHPLQLVHPEWSPIADVDPELSARTRDELFDAAAEDGRLWLAGHWPYPGSGRIVRLRGKRVFRAL